MRLDECVDLARMCWRQAHLTTSPEVAAHFRKMEHQYQQQAAMMDGGRLPEIGDPETDGKPMV
jgi:hypothetical protein